MFEVGDTIKLNGDKRGFVMHSMVDGGIIYIPKSREALGFLYNDVNDVNCVQSRIVLTEKYLLDKDIKGYEDGHVTFVIIIPEE